MLLSARIVLVLTLLTAALGSLLGATASSASAATACPSGYVCLYNGTTTSTGIQVKWLTYGAHNLSNVYGNRLVVNNQTGGATFALCQGYNGVSCGVARKPGSYVGNLTPINSIKLARAATTTSGTSALGGTITKAEIVRRMQDWISRSPTYDQNNWIWDLGHTRTYRTDCSGFAAMALHMSGTVDTTYQVAGDSRFTKRFSLNASLAWRGNLGSPSVQTGDVLVSSHGHEFVFGSWNSNGSFNYYTFGGLHPKYYTNVRFTDSSLDFWPTTSYTIYRYNKVAG